VSAENKTRPTAASVPAFLAAITDETRRADARALVTLMRHATGEKPPSAESSPRSAAIRRA
jgi:hypothetical protein